MRVELTALNGGEEGRPRVAGDAEPSAADLRDEDGSVVVLDYSHVQPCTRLSVSAVAATARIMARMMKLKAGVMTWRSSP